MRPYTKIKVFPQYPIRDASSRYRVYYIGNKLQSDYDVEFYHSSSDYVFNRFYRYIFYRPESILKKQVYKFIRFIYYNIIFITRFKDVLFRIHKGDLILLHRSLVPNGVGILEKLLIFKKTKIIYDFDDAIYNFPKNRKNLPSLLASSRAVIAGNPTLLKYSKSHNKNTYLLVTVPYNLNQYAIKRKDDKVIIGWIGNPLNLKHLEIIKEPLEKILLEFENVELLIVCDGQHIPFFSKLKKQVKYVKWSLDNEYNLISTFDIGIMPLIDCSYTKGKCGFKLLQYMYCSKPVLCSPVGVNSKLVKSGFNGYHATSDSQWYNYLKTFVLDFELRQEFGVNGKGVVDQLYNINKYCMIITKIIQRVETA